jgi:hypothetical protein
MELSGREFNIKNSKHHTGITVIGVLGTNSDISLIQLFCKYLFPFSSAFAENLRSGTETKTNSENMPE